MQHPNLAILRKAVPKAANFCVVPGEHQLTLLLSVALNAV